MAGGKCKRQTCWNTWESWKIQHLKQSKHAISPKHSIPQNLESKSGETPPVLRSGFPPISDSSFPLHFELLPPKEKVLLKE